MTFHPGEAAPKRPPEAAARNRKLIDLLHLDFITAGLYMARRGMMALSLPMEEGEFDTLVAAFEDFLEARAPQIVESAEAKR